jgi:hypothetical protein
MRPGTLRAHPDGVGRRPASSLAAGRWVVPVIAAACLLGGCGRRVAVTDEAETKAQDALRAVAAAYNAAIAKRGKPPAGPDDIKPFLPEGAALDDALRSPRDGQPFVVIWGADPRKGMDIKPLVIAYEARGGNGRRLVFTAMGVFAMENSRFAEARFPEGHAPQ